MIRVNLLEGAADTRAATRATKAVAKTTQQLLMVVGAVLLLVAQVEAYYMVSTARLADAEKQLKEQQQIAAQLKADRERKEQLEKQITAVKNRIKIIEDLEKAQKGPSQMLNLINEKMPPRADMVLEEISQSEKTVDQVLIKGTARTEEVVSQFARGLELGSQGLFQSLAVTTTQATRPVPVDPSDPENKETRLETVYNFTITTKYLPTAVGAATGDSATGAAPAAAGT
jgi:Tfp pilus assembly protein PilN